VEISAIKEADLHPWRHPCPYVFHFSEDWREHYEHIIASRRWSSSRAVTYRDRGGEAISTIHSGDYFASVEAHRANLTDPDLAGHIAVLRARGHTIYGSPIPEVFPEIPRADFLDSILQDVLSPDFGLTSETIPPVYMILNACRTLAYLRDGEIFSKAEGGHWALKNIPMEHHAIIQDALSAYAGEGEIPRNGLKTFQKYMLDAIQCLS
jgi:streptomycin 3"-adenylyltransferase